MSGFLSKAVFNCSLIKTIYQFLSTTFLIFGNALLKVITSGKLSWVATFSLVCKNAF